MPADLEAQLRASLPGRETEVQDRDAGVRAEVMLDTALAMLESAGRLLRTHAKGCAAIEWVEEAELLTRKSVAIKGPLAMWIRNHPAGRTPR